MESSIDISVIIPVYNASALLNRCLDSVFTQTLRYRVEAILVDDGSTDNSVELIEARKASNITLIRQKNAGPAAARNKGIAAARGKYLAFLDADDYWLPGFIDTTVDFLSQHPEAVAVSVGQRHVTISGEHIAPAALQDENNGLKARVLPDFYEFWARHNHVCTGSVMMCTEIARQTGGQRVELRICEDLEFWAYLATWGQWGFIPQILFVSDGLQVTRQLGWLEKNKKRWASAPTLEVWEERITTRMPHPLPLNYRKSCGRIAKNLCYSILLSKRKELARQQCRAHGKVFPTCLLTRLMRLAAITPFTWNLLANALIFREYNRK